MSELITLSCGCPAPPLAVVLLSGGIDSAVVLAGSMPHVAACLSFDYGQRHGRREGNAAARIAEHYGVRRVVFRLPFIGEHFKSALLKGGAKVPLAHYEDPSQAATVVPFRNGILLAIAAGYAESIGAGEVLLGCHRGDAAIYPDCRPAWVTAMGEAVWRGTERKVKLRAPLIDLTKAEIVARGRELRAPLELTYSCYLGAEEHCGECGACRERAEALAA